LFFLGREYLVKAVTAFLSASALALTLGSGGAAFATSVSITLTTDVLGLGSTKINYAGNNSAVEADRAGQLETSTANNVGSQLYVQTDNLAGQGTLSNPLLATITSRTHLDVQNNLPVDYDLHAGVITLTNDSGTLANDGLGVRGFAIDTSGDALSNPNFGKRYVNPAHIGTNVNGFQMEGSKEVSGGVDVTDFNDFVVNNESPPTNSPPHVDEDVTFDINDAELIVAADSVTVLLTKIKAGSNNDPFDLALDLDIILVGGSIISNSYEFLSDAPDVFSVLSGETDVIEIDFSAPSLGLSPTDTIDRFVIGGRDDPADGFKETDEHFLINGFTASFTPVPEPSTALLVGLGLIGLAARRRMA
jgi:hypothetical protein